MESMLGGRQNQRESVGCLQGPPPPPLYGKSSYIGRTPVAVVECWGGALWREKQGKSRFRFVRCCSLEKQIFASSKWNGTTTFTVIFEPMQEQYRYFECLNNGENDPESSRDLARDRTSYEDANRNQVQKLVNYLNIANECSLWQSPCQSVENER